ncbi:MAG: hypothetical protein KAI40_12215 [Desulfobacterales bacterium]|nr:hypothetical protein [Desulfobacterales bacterium]
MHFKSLKINIIINIGILLITGMLITDFIITSFSKNEIIKAEFSKTEIILFNIKNTISQFDNDSKKDDNIKKYLFQIVEQFDIYSIYFFNKTEHSVYKNHKIPHNSKNIINQQQIQHYTFQAIDKNRQISHYFGQTWGIFWQDKKYLSISYPVDKNMGITFVIALDNVYSTYREKQKIILFYILFNTIFLCFIALIRFSNIIIKPIKRLTNIAKEYNGENDTLYMLHPVENEFGILSSSLNSMINRISDDKQKLEHNIDELKKAQVEMIRAEKMSSIGKLSAGVAHEIGNPLGIVLGYLELLKQKNISDKDKHDFLNRSEIEIQRIDKIIKQLLNLSRRSKIEYLPNSVHEIIKDTISILKIQPSFSKIDFKLELNAYNDTVRSDGDQLKQVFLNLILNAADAILLKKSDNKTGLIEIKTIEIEEKYSSFLEIRIFDNGTGVSKDDLNKIFDPFFTTKEPGSGTGLGLWVSYMIVDEINGSIRTDLGEGTTFIIKLPLQKNGND